MRVIAPGDKRRQVTSDGGVYEVIREGKSPVGVAIRGYKRREEKGQ